MARLSSGARINSASDDAAGVSIASRLSAEIRGTDQAIRNALDGQSLVDTVEGAHKEIEKVLQRMREVSVQYANDTNNDNDRHNLALELGSLLDEINRISDMTSWAGQSLMDGSSSFSFQVGSGKQAGDAIDLNISSVNTVAIPSSTIRRNRIPRCFSFSPLLLLFFFFLFLSPLIMLLLLLLLPRAPPATKLLQVVLMGNLPN